MKGNGNLARRRARRIATVKRADGSVDAMGSQSGRIASVVWGQCQPERRITARDTDVVNSKSRIMEKGKNSGREEQIKVHNLFREE